jgi:hypothetical protein
MKPAIVAAAALAAAFAATPEARAEDWEFKISPYFWATGIEGDVAVFPRLPPVHVDESFSDILDQLQFAATAAIEARKGSFGILSDLSYVDTGTSRGLPRPNFTSVGVGTKTFTGTFATVWRVADRSRLDADFVAGVRLVWTETSVDLVRADGVVFSAEPDKMWLDPIVGARGIYTLAPRWSVTAYGDVGGGVSDFTWQVYGAANYHVNDGVRLSAGWRHYDVDFDDDGFIYDIAEDGPIIGATFSF